MLILLTLCSCVRLEPSFRDKFQQNARFEQTGFGEPLHDLFSWVNDYPRVSREDPQRFTTTCMTHRRGGPTFDHENAMTEVGCNLELEPATLEAVEQLFKDHVRKWRQANANFRHSLIDVLQNLKEKDPSFKGAHRNCGNQALARACCQRRPCNLARDFE